MERIGVSDRNHCRARHPFVLADLHLGGPGGHGLCAGLGNPVHIGRNVHVEVHVGQIDQVDIAAVYGHVHLGAVFNLYFGIFKADGADDYLFAVRH